MTNGFERTVCALGAALCLVSAPADAAAEEAPGGGGEFLEDPKVEAERLFGEGKALAAQGRHEEARALLRRALDFHRRPDIAGALGAEELRLGQYVEAARLSSYALGLMPPGGAESAKVAADLKRAKEHVATLELRIEPAGARVTLDGQPVDGSDRAEVFVLAGAHTLRAELEGYRPVEVSRTFQPVVSERVDLVLPREDEGAGGGGAETWVLVAGYGVAGLALVGGFVFVGMANGRAGEAEDVLAAREGDVTTPCCGELGALRDEQNTFSSAALWSFVGSGALAVGTTLYWVFAERADSPSARHGPQPWVGADGAGFGWSGRW